MTLRALLPVVCLPAMIACGGSTPPAATAESPPGTTEPSGTSPPPGPTTEPAAAADGGTALTAEACEAAGGRVVGDIGDGAIHRPGYRCSGSGEPPIGKITPPPGGPIPIEGSVCCR